MYFRNVIGQERVKSQLLEMVEHNRLSHALLFLGREGSGALPLAMAFARFIQCEKSRGQKPATAGVSLFGEEAPGAPEVFPVDACGQCSSCKKWEQLVHPDAHFSYPVIPRKSGDKPVSTDYAAEWREFFRQFPYGNVYDWLQFIGAENKQGNITAAECNEIIRKLSLKSFESPFKILVLWMPEYLDKEGNKLLKIIEEPPPNTLFILVAENESMILPTILSRCLLVKIPAIERADLTAALRERAQVPEVQAGQVAAIADGNYREALLLMQHAEEDWQSMVREWLNAILKTGPAAQVKWVEETARLGREKQKQFLRYFNHLLEQAIRLSALEGSEQAASFPIPAHEYDFARRLNKIADRDALAMIIKELDLASYYIERNAHAKLLFQALTIKLYHIIADKSLILI